MYQHASASSRRSTGAVATRRTKPPTSRLPRVHASTGISQLAQPTARRRGARRRASAHSAARASGAARTHPATRHVADVTAARRAGRPSTLFAGCRHGLATDARHTHVSARCTPPRKPADRGAALGQHTTKRPSPRRTMPARRARAAAPARSALAAGATSRCDRQRRVETAHTPQLRATKRTRATLRAGVAARRPPPRHKQVRAVPRQPEAPRSACAVRRALHAARRAAQHSTKGCLRLARVVHTSALPQHGRMARLHRGALGSRPRRRAARAALAVHLRTV